VRFVDAWAGRCPCARGREGSYIAIDSTDSLRRAKKRGTTSGLRGRKDGRVLEAAGVACAALVVSTLIDPCGERILMLPREQNPAVSSHCKRYPMIRTTTGLARAGPTTVVSRESRQQASALADQCFSSAALQICADSRQLRWWAELHPELRGRMDAAPRPSCICTLEC